MNRLLRYLLAAAGVCALMAAACESRSLVAVEVIGDALFDDVTLTVTANNQETKQFPHAVFGPGNVYRIGVYLPPDMTGTVRLDAAADDGQCVLGRGNAQVLNVKAGEISMTVQLL